MNNSAITNKPGAGQPRDVLPFAVPAVPRLTNGWSVDRWSWLVIGLCSLIAFVAGFFMKELKGWVEKKPSSAIAVMATTRPLTVPERMAIAREVRLAELEVMEEQRRREEQAARLNRIIDKKPAQQAAPDGPARPVFQAVFQPPADPIDKEKHQAALEAIEARLDKLDKAKDK